MSTPTLPVMAIAPPSPVPTLFYALWQSEAIRERLFELLAREDICAVRLANSACCNLVTKRLFVRIHLTFSAGTFTRESRILALARIGHHIEHLTFSLPHSDATFLPPLIHPASGREINFLYTPHTSMASALCRPRYAANSELGEILTAQYPPLFHAASNVPSFINALRHLSNLRHLTVKTPNQNPAERYRRSIVDYALLSLRIAVERNALTKLNKLSLSGVHAAAFAYLRHLPGFGASPAAARRWRQIRKLHVSVEAWDFYGPSPGRDHLKLIDDYIRFFAPGLDKFSFTWLGRRGPCPLALAGDPLFAPPRSTRKLFNEVTGPMSPLPASPPRPPVVMPRLRFMAVRNATMNAPQLRGLICGHRATVREFDFDNVALIKGGSWDDALAPLTGGGADAWSRYSLSGGSESSFRPGTARSGSSGSAVASSLEDEQLPASSAAAAAASRELFEVDMDGVVFGGANDVDALEAGVEEWARGVTAAAAQSSVVATIPEGEEMMEEDDGGLASDIEAARQASLGFSTKLKKRRIRKKRSRKHSHREETEDERDRRSERKSERKKERHSDPQHGESSRYHSRSRHKHSRSDDTSDRHTSRDRSHSRHGHRHHRRHHSEDIPAVPAMPEVIGTDDEAFYRPQTPPKARKLSITAPILNSDPLPVLLQPTVYDPSAKTAPFVGICEVAPDDDGLSSVQRTIEADLLAEAEDAAARMSALRRAKETVLMKLSREFCKRKGSGPPHSKDSAAVTAGLSALNLGLGGGNNGLSCASSSVGLRIREGLFGRSLANVAIAPDHRSIDSQSALVPLMFSRS